VGCVQTEVSSSICSRDVWGSDLYVVAFDLSNIPSLRLGIIDFGLPSCELWGNESGWRGQYIFFGFFMYRERVHIVLLRGSILVAGFHLDIRR